MARHNVAEGGKPFACVVVDAASGEVLHETTNQVVQSGDKTAHAEIVAIREIVATGRTDLRGCEVYVTAYPCPRCLGALYYAEPERVVFAATREHDEDGGRYLTLATFYDQYAVPPAERALPVVRGEHDHPTTPFEDFAARQG